ncbi:curli biogenesis system outer membrane secretion channel CsgG [Paucibacter oligotrophus]|uniref:Curli biogenesis system outer membrane secretion channel CsgG n=1 Tax=Roseateles oligotrophus TaxID=1769250 RepID=A0A840LF79_9BURK|nr:CsgG/HfaB family protein [Roseateles oligotrophus]MBB4845655.1 curli biogenesis system outer membrane secretion channel CsgG [Roseateles oligotrophus]
MWRHSVLALCACAALVACGNKDEAAAKSAAAASAPAQAGAPLLDVGKLQTVPVTAAGFGASASEAVAEAMKLALLQVNGAAIDMSTLSVKYGLDVTLGKNSASLRAQEFTDAVQQRSGGVIQGFKLLELVEPGLLDKRYKASIEARIASFSAPESLQKIKLVVAPLKFPAALITVGGSSVASAEVAANVRQRVVDALVNSGRFAVLDREFNAELEQELDLIAGGRAPAAEQAKLAQAVSADLVWTGKVSSMAYQRHAQQLRASNRELVSYSGGWALSQKLVNVATRQVVVADSLQGKAPSTEATTMDPGVDGRKVLENMTNDLVKQVVASIMRRSFPVTVVQREGDKVVLSQGGGTLRQGARYAVVQLGGELKDPQTGQSLGRSEQPCCELVVERVTPNLSYGRLEGASAALEALPLQALQLREELAASALKAGPAADKNAAAEPGQAKPARSPKPAAAEPKEQAAPAAPKADDKW